MLARACAPAAPQALGAAGEENFAGWPPNASFPYVFDPLGGGPKSQKDAESRDIHIGTLTSVYFGRHLGATWTPPKM